ncbi:MAG: MmgE/PrpD family protein [Chloroflexi bacterium]|nr:MmgE/PrpD family protein [Chloroflexota bacterium]
MSGITQTLAEFAARTTFDDLPRPVIEKTKQVLFDAIGCALGSYVTDRARIAIELTEAMGGHPQASIIGHRKTSYPLAAFANGELISTLDYEPIGPLCPHVCPSVIASSLAMAERVNASGKGLITAVAVGLEAGGRVAGSISEKIIPKDEPPYYEDAPRHSYSQTIFGAAAGAGNILRSGSSQIANMLGVAGTSTSVAARIKWGKTSGPLPTLKYGCSFGWMAQLATTAALLVERGFTGDTTVLDGEWGFWKIWGSPFFRPEVITGELGRTWHLDRVMFKPYPCDGLAHSFIQGINTLMQQHAIKPPDIEAISIKGDPVLVEPNKAGAEVRSFSDTQFRMAYIAAAAVYHGLRPDPNWQSPSIFNDPEIKELMGKVIFVLHPRAAEIIARRFKAGLGPNFHDNIVEITAGGKTFSIEVSEPKGHYNNPMTDGELIKKFRDNACHSLVRTDKVERAIERIYGLERVDHVCELTALLTIA